MIWTLLLIGAAAILAVVFYRQWLSYSQDNDRPPFRPNPANDTEVLCTGWDEDELKKALANFRSAYQQQLDPSVVFQTSELEEDKFRITFPNDIAPDMLPFLVNYLQYPEGLDLATHQVAVLARVTLTDQFPLPRSDYLGQTARIYVPADDDKYDLVYVAVGSEYFECSFKDLHWSPVKEGRIRDGVEELW